ncbi:Alg9-like mannosyltransferase family-domain-containing protein [Zopfochytrium polystomum]|nr:Alg9-like mannosyltransferase family-domain-containing protein [Zopfochytrium polystomum]
MTRPPRPPRTPPPIAKRAPIIFAAALATAFRVFVAAPSVVTFFSPDEYWQSLEVAHHAVFGYGALTWEWTHRIRGFMHPLLFAAVYKALSVMGLDNSALFILAPKILQAMFAAAADVSVYLLAKRLYGPGPARWALFASLVSFFNFFCATRTFSNSIETSLTSLALLFWPWPGTSSEGVARRELLSLSIAAFACILRPTNVVIWLVMGTDRLARLNWMGRTSLISRAIAVSILAVAISVAVDSAYYGEWTLAPLNFFYFNVARDIATFYGSNPWHWYLSQGVPLVFFTHTPFVVWAAFAPNPPDSTRIATRLVVATVAVYSALPHKEFRFVMPLLPVVCVEAGRALHAWRVDAAERRRPRFFWTAIGFTVLLNALAGLYLGLVHQRGVTDVMHWLRNERSLGGVLFLMPCHSTPLYSYLHRNVPTRYITCHPPLSHSLATPYLDESDIFYKDPRKFFESYFSNQLGNRTLPWPDPPNSTLYVDGQEYAIEKYFWPSHVVLFEALLNDVAPLFEGSGYAQCLSLFNSHFHDDWRRKGNVVVFCDEQPR